MNANVFALAIILFSFDSSATRVPLCRKPHISELSEEVAQRNTAIGKTLDSLSETVAGVVNTMEARQSLKRTAYDQMVAKYEALIKHLDEKITNLEDTCTCSEFSMQTDKPMGSITSPVTKTPTKATPQGTSNGTTETQTTTEMFDRFDV